MDASKDVNPELESFREQWRAEVRAKNPAVASSQKQTSSNNGHAGPSKPPAAPAPPRPTTHPSSGKLKLADTEDDDDVEPQNFDDPVPVKPVTPSDGDNGDLLTALDHYERAVEKESQGSLGDSLMLYRKAFRVRFTICLRRQPTVLIVLPLDGPQSRQGVQK